MSSKLKVVSNCKERSCADWLRSKWDKKTTEGDTLALSGQGEFIKNGKRYVRLITNNYVRDLLIPSKGPNINTTALTENDVQKFIDKPAELQKKNEDISFFKQNHDEKAAASALRKKELLSFPPIRDFGAKLLKLEVEAEAKANFLTNRAKEIRQEDDDDIKLCNKLILGTKCQAIRDAQVEEKKTIQKEWMDEEKRLVAMMEQERKRMLAKEVEEKMKAMEKKNNYIKAITDQVKQNELEREMEAERVIEEQKIINEAITQTRIDEFHEMEQKEKQKEQMREDLNKINKIIIEAAEKEREQAKIDELKIQYYFRKKAEEEAEREAEAELAHQAKEKELAKLRAAQQKAQDSQASKDEILSKKVQEEYELQWRAKEKEAAEEKRRRNEQLKKDRERQIQERKQHQELEAAKELEEVNKWKMIDLITTEKEKEDQEKKRQELLIYKAALLKQINEKEYEKLQVRRQTFEEGLGLKLESEIRDISIKKTIKKKIATIRTHNVPEKYIEEIERKLNVQTKS